MIRSSVDSATCVPRGCVIRTPHTTRRLLLSTGVAAEELVTSVVFLQFWSSVLMDSVCRWSEAGAVQPGYGNFKKVVQTDDRPLHRSDCPANNRGWTEQSLMRRTHSCHAIVKTMLDDLVSPPPPPKLTQTPRVYDASVSGLELISIFIRCHAVRDA
ncbi:hypothetical protein E2C01_044454 [Portunus trituberculatus]|uniref:Uncharacterized protein n=1 Tax=Portunus trituberculatus TaxID=210409 RepID=A0A5B7G2E2_PORTR|nr:hypothetical protein [Portunus trituberculatus]